MENYDQQKKNNIKLSFRRINKGNLRFYKNLRKGDIKQKRIRKTMAKRRRTKHFKGK